MIHYVEAPDRSLPPGLPSVFLAGGITGCPDWQKAVVATVGSRLPEVDGVLVNPRRADFPIDDPTAAEAQITWEHDLLRQVDAISFWFAAEEIQPIALYELGAWSMTDKPLFVGVHPNYKRRQDAEIQTRLVRDPNDVGGVTIVYNIFDLCRQIIKFLEEHS